MSQLWLHSQARWLGSDSRASISFQHTQTAEKVRAWANVIAATAPCTGHYHQSADALVTLEVRIVGRKAIFTQRKIEATLTVSQ